MNKSKIVIYNRSWLHKNKFTFMSMKNGLLKPYYILFDLLKLVYILINQNN